MKGAVGLGAQPSVYFGKEKSVGHIELSLCPSLSALALPCVSLPKAGLIGLICLSLAPLLLPHLKSAGPSRWPSTGSKRLPFSERTLKELADEAHFCAKPLESSLASIIKENDAIGKIC